MMHHGTCLKWQKDVADAFMWKQLLSFVKVEAMRSFPSAKEGFNINILFALNAAVAVFKWLQLIYMNKL